MIPRILLLILAWFTLNGAVRGFKVNAAYPREPAKVTVDQLQAAGQNPPLFVLVNEVTPADGVCLTTTYEKDEQKLPIDHLYVPLVTKAQAESIEAGTPTNVPTFVEYDDCVSQRTETSVQGVIEAVGTDLDQTVKEEFKKSGVVVTDHPVILHEQYAPTSVGGNVLALIIGLGATVAGLVPFFKRNKWPKEATLADKNTAEVLAALYPVLKVHGDVTNENLHDLIRAAKDTSREFVLLRINAIDSSGHPAHAVLTNRRYLLFRTKRQWFLSVLKVFDRMLDKVPFGGLLGLMLEPFGETYEVLISPRHQVNREAMGYKDDELIGGTLPWKKICDLSLAEVVNRSKSIGIKKGMWSETLKVEFAPRKLLKFLSTPSDFEIEPSSARVAIGRLVSIFSKEFAWLKQSVEENASNLEIRWPWPAESEKAK